MSNLGNQVYNLQMQNLVTLWIIDFTPVISSITGVILHITAYKDRNGANITFAGQTYDYVGVESSGFRSEINGQLPEPTMNFDKQSLNSLPAYQSIKAQFTAETGQVFFDWRGARITRIRTTSNYLDNGDSPNAAIQDVQEFFVDQVTRTTNSTIELKLTVSIGADRLTNQSVQELSFNRCGLRYRTWNGSSFIYTDENAGGCPYGNPTTKSNWSNVPEFGNRYYTQADSQTDFPEIDICSYTVKGCQLRFDPNEMGLTLPFLGKYKATGNNTSGGGDNL